MENVCYSGSRYHFRKDHTMGVDQDKYQELFKELSLYEEYGIPIMMDGKPASPMQITTAHMVKEEKSYMRDYILDKDGHISELCFYTL